MKKVDYKKLKAFYEDKMHWRPPSLSSVARHMGWRSKGSAAKALKKLYGKRILTTAKTGKDENPDTGV